MTRFALKIEYNGQGLCGWQRQREHISVQSLIEEALGKLETPIPRITGAGRTDAGVHATGQIAHVDLSRPWGGENLMGAINHHLRPHKIAITAAAPVADDFSARFSAIERRYLFRLIARRAPLVFEAGLAWQIKHQLDLNRLREGASYLIGRHDFTTFRSVHCQALSPIKTLDEISITEHELGNGGIEYRFILRARSFLHNQVRSIIGTLERVGAGAWEPEWVKAALEAKERSACGPVSPPDGLYLTDVIYPEPIFN